MSIIECKTIFKNLHKKKPGSKLFKLLHLIAIVRIMTEEI